MKRHRRAKQFTGALAVCVIALTLVANVGGTTGQQASTYYGPLRGTGHPGTIRSAYEYPVGTDFVTPGQVQAVPFLTDLPPATFRSLKAKPLSLPGPQPSLVEDRSVAPLAPKPSLQSRAPGIRTDFQGITQTTFVPPDNGTAAGPNHILEMVNASWRLFNRDGTPATGLVPFCGASGWWTSTLPAGVTSCFDPRMVYDQFANRWVMVADARKATDPKGSWYLLATSWTSDPLGTWCTWALQADSDPAVNWADYPAVGIDDQAVYLTSNQFNFGNVFQFVKIRILGKAQLYNNSCNPPTWTDITTTAGFTLQPAHTFGTPGVEYFVNSFSGFGSSVTLWTLSDPLGTPMLSSVSVPVGSYVLPPDATQLGSEELIDTGDARLLNAVYRNGVIWTTHPVSCGPPRPTTPPASGCSGSIRAVRQSWTILCTGRLERRFCTSRRSW